VPYVIDSSAIIDGRRRYYPPSVFPGLWENIEELIARGELIAPDEVYADLERKDDEVHAWAKNQNGLFIPLNDDIQIATTDVLAAYPEWIPPDRSKNVADAFVVALARVRGCPVVSGEKWTDSPYPERNKIPNVCDGLDVVHLSFLQMLLDLGWRFPPRYR
jgi:hypothetical protein